MEDINIPRFEFSGNSITISGRSLMEDPVDEWGKFITNLRIYIEGRKRLNLNFRLDGISSSNSLYITNIFSVLNEYRRKCEIIVNWYFFEADEDMEFLGEHYQDRNQKLAFKLKIRDE
jgi:hypothetical protein